MQPSAQTIGKVDRFLGSLPSRILKRARGYFLSGNVIALEQLEENLFFAVVRGGDDYQVGLEFDGDECFSECTCSHIVNCKHAAAALLALRESVGNNGKTNGRSGNEAREIRQANKTRANRKSSDVPQPPPSPLTARLRENLGRDLDRAEVEFVCRIQRAYGRAIYDNMMESDLAEIAQYKIPHAYSRLWSPWDNPPADDFEFWLHVALELQKRGWQIPTFIHGITDLAAIEATMRELEREKEIQLWKDRFCEFQARPAPNPEVVELRLAIFNTEARLQWRTNPELPFADFKQQQGRKFGNDFQQGSLTPTTESLPIWFAAFKPLNYENWWTYKYADYAARQILSRLLRIPLPPHRIVTADGEPLARAAQPLRLELRPPENGDDNYDLRLITPDGSPAPPIFCALSGNPVLYLTERGLFAGPSTEFLDTGSHLLIPAPALESPEGLRFLHATEVPLPAPLAQRIKTVPVTVTISCDLRRPYPGATAEDVVVTVAAAATGLKTEHFTANGWSSSRSSNRSGKNSSAVKADAVIIHDRAAQKHFPRALGALPNLKYGGYYDAWYLRLTKKTPEIFLAWLKSLPAEIEVQLDRDLATLRDEPVSGSVSLDVAEAGIDWFDLKVALNVTDTTLSPDELKLLLNAKGGYVRLAAKGWRRLRFNLTPEDDEQLARLGLDARDFSNEPQRFHALQLADDAAKKFLAPDRVEKIQRRVEELKTRVAPPVPTSIRAQMRPYQIEGFHFLAYLTSNRFGGVLADDMGLGKTLQTLAWLAWLRENPSAHDTSNGASAPHRDNSVSNGCSLVVCPKSVMDNWRAEAERFFPGLRVRLWRGEGAEELPAARANTDLIVLNYSQLRGLSPGIAGHRWLAAILDEAQYIKNPDSQTAQAARALQTQFRLALTGTPIENRLLDLWSILGFAMPGVLGNRSLFARQFNAKDDPLARRRLAARVRPFLLRRAKSQVAKDLPDRIEEDLLCEMESEQKALYQAELKRARQILLKLKTSEQLNAERFNILTSLLRLRQICCHPALVNGSLRQAESAKVVALEDLLEPLMEEGHKVLVFSQFVTMLDLLRETVNRRQWPHFYLAGDTENRGQLV